MATTKKVAGKTAGAGAKGPAKSVASTKRTAEAKKVAKAGQGRGAAAAKGVAIGKKVPAKKASAKKTAAKKQPAKKVAAKKLAGKKQPAVKSGAAKKGEASLAKGKDPKGGLTAEGRRYFKEKEGLNLRPGVKGKADTPEKMVRKGSFLRRHFANPPGPVKGKKGEPTRQALQAAAWGEPVPQNEADEKKLAAKGSELLEQYHAIRDGEKDGEKAGKKAGAKPGKKGAAANRVGKKG